MFEKFLNKTPVSKDETEEQSAAKRRPRGRPCKPDSERKYPKRKDHRHGPDGRVLRKYRKRKGPVGWRHPAAKRATRKRKYKRNYQQRKAEQRLYRQTLRRRYSQSQSYQRLTAQRQGKDPKEVWQLSYAEYLLMWETAPPVWIENRFVTAKSLIGNPLVSDLNTYMDRLDRTKPFTRDNCKVFRGGKPLC